MTTEKITPEESLRLIRSMIESTRAEISGNAHLFLVWGWITFISCTAQFVLKHILHYEKHYLVWQLILLGAAYSIYWKSRQRKQRRVKTYVDQNMAYLWTGMVVSYIALSVVLTKIGWGSTVFPFFIILYALGTFVSGGILKFKPLQVGGILAWVLAVAAMYLSYDYQMLAGAAAILVSYIIPAYMLRARNQSLHSTQA